jgi:hypothetical protein
MGLQHETTDRRVEYRYLLAERPWRKVGTRFAAAYHVRRHHAMAQQHCHRRSRVRTLKSSVRFGVVSVFGEVGDLVFSSFVGEPEGDTAFG